MHRSESLTPEVSFTVHTHASVIAWLYYIMVKFGRCVHDVVWLKLRRKLCAKKHVSVIFTGK